MLSDVTISVGSQSITLPGLYLLIGVLIILGLVGFIVAMTNSRRIERKTSEVTEILVVQLERIGDAFDRLVTQNTQRAANEAAAVPNRHRDRFLPNWPAPGRGTPPQPRVIPENSALERAAQKPAPEAASPVEHVSQTQVVAVAQDKPKESQSEEQTVESGLSEPARSILFSMLGR
jgi:hypothetical protein